jgi:hypothetical protein
VISATLALWPFTETKAQYKAFPSLTALRALIEEASSKDHFQSGLLFQSQDGWFVPKEQ